MIIRWYWDVEVEERERDGWIESCRRIIVGVGRELAGYGIERKKESRKTEESQEIRERER